MQENIIGLLEAKGTSYVILRKNRLQIVIKSRNKKSNQSIQSVHSICQLQDGIAWDVVTIVMARGRLLHNMPLPRLLPAPKKR